jgi:hypothetical protein
MLKLELNQGIPLKLRNRPTEEPTSQQWARVNQQPEWIEGWMDE